jgi:hypothetical protein
MSIFMSPLKKELPKVNPEISGFVNETLSKHKSENLTVSIVKEEEAEEFAYAVKEEMEKAH